MRGFRFYRSVKSLIGVVILLGAMLFMFGYVIHGEISTRDSYRHTYGENWQVHFEQRFGSVEKAHTKTIIGCASITVIAILIWLICHNITNYNSGRSGHRHHRKHRQEYKW